MSEYYEQKLEDLPEEELKARGWKHCNSCGKLRPPELFYKAKRVNQKAYVCKICHRLAVRSYRKVPESYAWFYRRVEKMRNHVKQRGLEFNLTVADYKELKNADTCYYCGCPTDVITLDRKDNNVGYIKENMVPACYLCNKIKGNIFNEEEMKIIGRAVRMYNKRVNRDASSQSSYGKDEELINKIVNDPVVS